jgi:uroporphyrinogen-III synthase
MAKARNARLDGRRDGLVMKVLITRPRRDAEAFAALCAKAGIEPTVAPLMTVKTLRQPVSLSGAGALAFTSANGVRAFAANCAARDLPVFAVGEASAAAAAAAGFSDIRTAKGDVDSLTALIARTRGQLKGAVLHVAGTQRAGDLLAALQANRIAAQRMVLYDAQAAKTLPSSAIMAIDAIPPVDWVALFSPRSATLFARLVKAERLDDRLTQIRAACLSAAVAEAAKASPWRAVWIAERPAAESMIDLMLRCA